MQKESSFKKSVIKELKSMFPGSYWMTVQQRSLRGHPDLIGCIDGLFIALELKKEGAQKDKSRERLQQRVAFYIRKAQGIAFDRVCPENWEEVKLEIRRRI